ncbi:MAG: hypothetical protein WCG23_00360 [bacterium]
MVSSIQFLQNRAANLNRVGFAAEKENTEASQPKDFEEQIKDAFVKSKQSQVIPESPKEEVKAEEPPVVPEPPKEDIVNLEPQTVIQESPKEDNVEAELPPVIPEQTKEEALKQRKLANNRHNRIGIGIGIITGALLSTGHQFLKKATLLKHVSRIVGGAVIGGGLMAVVNYFTKSVSVKAPQEKQKESIK